MKTNEQIMADLQGSVHANKTIFKSNVSQLDSSVIIVIFTDGTQANVSAL
jgi:hypothetical protein